MQNGPKVDQSQANSSPSIKEIKEEVKQKPKRQARTAKTKALDQENVVPNTDQPKKSDEELLFGSSLDDKPAEKKKGRARTAKSNKRQGLKQVTLEDSVVQAPSPPQKTRAKGKKTVTFADADSIIPPSDSK